MTPGLIERLEAAGEGSRELDWRIADLTGHPSFERKVEGLWPPFAERSRSDSAIPAYTTSLDAALALAERVLPGWFVGVQPWFHTDPDRAMHRAYVVRPDWARWNPVDDDWCESIWGRSAATPALSVCIAILKARATQEQG